MTTRGKAICVLGSVALASATQLCGASSAGAGTWAHRDAVGDSVGRVDNGGLHPVRDDRVADISAIRVFHGKRNVSLVIRVRGIDDAPGRAWNASIKLVTSKEATFFAEYSSGDMVSGKLTDIRRRPLTCSDYSFEGVPNGIKISFPRDCIGSPWRFRAGGTVDAQYETQQGTAQVFDEAGRSGHYSRSMPALGSWVNSG